MGYQRCRNALDDVLGIPVADNLLAEVTLKLSWPDIASAEVLTKERLLARPGAQRPHRALARPAAGERCRPVSGLRAEK